MKTHDEGHRDIVEAVVVAVKFHGEKGADEIRSFYVVVPGSKRLQSWQDFVDPFTKLHEI